MNEFICKPFYDLSTDELYAILSLRQEVFVVEQDCVYLDTDFKDQHCWHVMAWDDEGKLVAYTRLVPKGLIYDEFTSIGRVITAPSVRGSGFGKKLINASIDWIERLFGKQAVKISAQCYLIRFYESFGFEIHGEEYLEDGIPHIAMILRKD